MSSFCWEFNTGLLPAASLLLPSPSNYVQGAKTPTASAHRESVRLASPPGLAPHCCLLANIQLPGNVESAQLLFHLIFLTPCSGFFSSAAPAVLALPKMAKPAPAAVCASCEVPGAYLTSAALPRLLISQTLQSNVKIEW